MGQQLHWGQEHEVLPAVCDKHRDSLCIPMHSSPALLLLLDDLWIEGAYAEKRLRIGLCAVHLGIHRGSAVCVFLL